MNNVKPIDITGVPSDRGTCDWVARPMERNILGDRLQIVDRGYSTYTWTGTDWEGGSVSATTLAGQSMHMIDGKAVPSTSFASFSGLTITVAPFSVQGLTFTGGSITLPAEGTWFVGVELSSSVLRVLPRLGHRGWVPLLRAVCTSTTITSATQIVPQVPASRIPRTLTKVLAGKAINVVVMGSSLTQSDGGATTWPGMVFGAGTNDKYKVPVSVTCQYTGVGASPNQYQLAQLGFASKHSGYGFPDAGFSYAIIGDKAGPNGRSSLFTGVDLVVIGCLANGGDYRLECIEPIVRQLVKLGVEVIVVTDNVQGPSTSYNSMATGALYVDAPEIFRVADLYGVEVADTAAYVFEAHLRAGGVGIYGDSIHMASGAPAGPAAILPANGHEAWARAVRSIFSVGTSTTQTTVYNYAYSFDTGVDGWTIYTGATTLTNPSGTLLATKNTSVSNQWGALITLPVTLQIGDTVDFTGTITYSGYSPSIGMQNAGWASNNFAVAASGTVTTGRMTATKTTNSLLVFANFDAAPSGTTLQIDSVSLAVTIAGTVQVFDNIPTRPLIKTDLPPVRVVTDLKTPADAFVILPHDEAYYSGGAHADRGVVQAHPWGGSSFARRFSAGATASTDMLVLAAGKRAIISGDCAVAQYIVHYRDVADGGCTFNVNINGSFNKLVTIGAVPFGNEWWTSIFTPTEMAANSPTLQRSVEIQVVTGTLKIAALVTFTADISYLNPEQITYVGSGWLPKELSRSGLPGRPTDTVGNYATVFCPGRRLAWIISGNPGSKKWNAYSGQTQLIDQNPGGNYHIYTVAGLYGPNAMHTIRCNEVNAAGDQANGHALHIGGAIIINDR